MQRLALRDSGAFLIALLVTLQVRESVANPVIGKLELPGVLPRHPPLAGKGFLDRLENPKKPVQGVNVGPYLLVVLEGDGKAIEAPPGQIPWDLVGESFARPVIGAPVGGEILIKNTSKTARTLFAVEDPKLIPTGPINPTGPKSFRVTEPRIYTIGDKDAPHLKGKVVVVATPYVATVEVTSTTSGNTGRFEFPDVPEGSYKLRIFYKDGWIDRPDDTVTVGAKGKTEISVKVPAGYPLAPKK